MMNCLCFFFLVTTVVATWILPTGVRAQTDVCVTGVAMDILCIDRGTLLDNPSLATMDYAHEHSIHCLVDVPGCVSSGYEVLVPSSDGGGTTYVRAVALDEYGNDQVVQLARAVGQCSTCTGEGSQTNNFVVTVQGQLVDDGGIGNSADSPPPLLQVVSIEVGEADCPTTPPPSGMPLAPPTLAPSVDSAENAEMTPSASPNIDVATPSPTLAPLAPPTLAPSVDSADNAELTPSASPNNDVATAPPSLAPPDGSIPTTDEPSSSSSSEPTMTATTTTSSAMAVSSMHLAGKTLVCCCATAVLLYFSS